MKNFIISALVISPTLLFAFSFSNLAKSASESTITANSASTSASTGTSATDANSELIAKQNENLELYKSSKEDFLKGYALIQNALGNTDAQKSAEASVAKIGEQTTVENIAKISDAYVNSASSSLTNIPEALSADAKSKYSEGLSCFSSALKKEKELSLKVLDLSKETKTAMSKATTMEKVQLASAFGPTMELAKIIPDDISKVKAVASETAAAAKAKGINVSSTLQSLLK